MFADKRSKWPVVDIVATKLDWESFLGHCSERDRRILEMRLDGHEQKCIAATLKVTPAAICQRLRRLRRRWDAQAVA